MYVPHLSLGCIASANDSRFWIYFRKFIAFDATCRFIVYVCVSMYMYINSKLDINFKTVTTNENFHNISENNAG